MIFIRLMSENLNWSHIIPALGLGGIIGAGITTFVNFILKEREHYRDIVKHKIESVSKSKHYIVQLVKYYDSLSSELEYGIKNGQEEINCFMCLYLICVILSIQRKLLEEY